MYSHFSHTEYYVFLNLMLFHLIGTDVSKYILNIMFIFIVLWLLIIWTFMLDYGRQFLQCITSHSCHIECSFQPQTVLVCFISLRSLFKDDCTRQDARLRWLKMHFKWNVLSFVIADNLTHLQCFMANCIRLYQCYSRYFYYCRVFSAESHSVGYYLIHQMSVSEGDQNWGFRVHT